MLIFAQGVLTRSGCEALQGIKFNNFLLKWQLTLLGCVLAVSQIFSTMFKPREVHTFVQDSGKRQILRKEAGKLVFPNCLVEFIVLKHSVMQNRVRVRG